MKRYEQQGWSCLFVVKEEPCVGVEGTSKLMWDGENFVITDGDK